MGHSRPRRQGWTYPYRAVPEWVKATVDIWTTAAGLSGGRVFRCVCRAGKYWGDGVTERLVWHVVKQYAAKLSLTGLAPHDLRRYAECLIMPNSLMKAAIASSLGAAHAA